MLYHAVCTREFWYSVDAKYYGMARVAARLLAYSTTVSQTFESQFTSPKAGVSDAVMLTISIISILQ